MASPEKLTCKPCSRNQKSSEGYKYCKECREILCRKCVKLHGSFKSLLGHSFQDTNSTYNEETLMPSGTCQIHADIPLEYYCPTHDAVCCKTCLAGKHKDCTDVTPIDVAAETVCNTHKIDEFSKTIEYLKKVLNFEVEKLEKKRCQLKENKLHIQKRIKKFKSRIIKLVNTMETKLITDSESTFQHHVSEIESQTKKLTNHQQNIQEIYQQFQMVNNTGDKRSLFIFLNAMENVVSNRKKNLERLLPVGDSCHIEIDFEESDILSQIKSLGYITVKENIPRSIDHKLISNNQKSYVPTKFKLDRTTEITYQGDVQITDIGVTRDDRLVLCNWLSTKLMIYSDKIYHEENIFLEGKPWGIAVVPNSDDAWVTLPKRSCIQQVNITTGKTEPSLPVPSGCYGITLIDEHFIALGKWREVHIITKKGRPIKTIEVGKESIHALTTGKNNTIYCCEGNGGLFYGINMKGSVSFAKDQPEMLWPVNVTADIQGNLYALGLQSNTVVRFSPDGKETLLMLGEEDGLKMPFAITFNKTFSKLIVSNESGKSVSVFSCKYV